jgi:hypothetical protein
LKNFTFLAFIVLFLLSNLGSYAQIKDNSPTIFERCGTMGALQQNLDRDPQLKSQYDQGMRDYERSLQNLQMGRTGSTMRTSALPDSVIIPVVVHIVLPNPNIVTDADVQFFLNRLNRDFSGRNQDSANGAPFYTVRGHSKIRFALARRTPAGLLTNGIERRVGNVPIAATTYQSIKHTSAGGLDPWTVTQYYNLWVGANSGGLLGIAPTIGVGAQTETTTSAVGIDGVCVNYLSFAGNTCYTIPAFALGRTAVHEIGHNFGLYHINGDASCGVDFKQIFGTCQLPDSLLAGSDDTPTQTSLTSGCPTGAAASGCPASPNPPGKMYQNYMDYTDDPCYSMFTIGQVKRMEYVLEFCRPGYLTTQGHLAPAGAITLDAAAFESVNPGGYELVGCNVINYSATASCPGSFSPRFRIKNTGLNVITSITAGYTLNNGPAQEVTINGLNLPSGAEYVVTTLPTSTLINGANVFKFYTKQPNSAADQNPANDTLTTTLNVVSTALPVTENFEGTFPPAPWTVVSVNTTGTANWTKNTPGRNSAGALYINNFLNSSGAIDDFRSASLLANPTDVVSISFDLAYKYYGSGTTTANPDTLAILISSDCGVTFSEVYKKWGVTLATAGGGTANYIPAAADWKTETILVPAALLASGRFQVIFRSRSRFGNNIWIDNINIVKKFDRDIRVGGIVAPVGNVCGNTISPQILVTNNGFEAITSFQVNYTTSTGAAGSLAVNTALAPGASTTVTLPNGTVPTGAQTITATITNIVFASGLADEDLSNNTLVGNFTVVVLNTRIIEGFEVTPVAGWTVTNPNGNNTWGVVTPGSNSLRSAFINNYDFNVPGNIDDLRSPFVSTTGIDSLLISFDLAHKNFPGSNDRLQVMAITGCGTVVTPTTYSKAGAGLATAGSSTAGYVAPAVADWRTERLSIGSSIFGTGGNVLIAFRNTNGFGNNIFIDNVNIVPLYKRDLQLVSINQPTAITCTTTITPSVTIRNIGSETVTGYKVSYTIDNGPAQITTITGVSIPRNATVTINLVASTTTVGAHTIRVLTFEPVTASGTGDSFTGNDTLSKSFNVLTTVPAPIIESFTGTAFPPPNWTVINADGGETWKRHANGNGNAGSAYINTFNYPSNGQRDDLVTPFISYGSVDTVRLTFDVAAATYSYPGSTEIPIDTLEVLITKDCGNTFTSVYKKWGTDLQTISAPNDPQTNEFFPTSPSQWRTETVELTQQYVSSSPVAVMFRVTNNFENNIFIDNVNFTARTLPALLKQQGYLVLPTAFNNNFTIWHYQTPTTVKYINVVNSIGQIVWSKQYNGNADRQISVDLTGKAAGVYIVNIGYVDGNRNVAQKVVKY